MKLSLQLVLLSLLLLFPLHEIFYHFVLKGRIRTGAALFYPEHILLILLAFAFRDAVMRAWAKWRLEMLLLSLYSAAFWISSILNPVRLDYAFQVFLTSIVIPVLLLLLLAAAVENSGFDLVNDGLLFLFTGVTVICAVGLVAYPVSFGVPRDFHQFVYDFRTGLALEGIRAGVWYGDLTAGNFNVFASYLLPAAFLVWGWFGSTRESTPRMFLAVALLLLIVAMNLYICYSRGSILVLNACAGLFIVMAWSLETTRRRLLLLAAGVLAFDVLVIAPPGAVTYWTSATHRQESNSVLQRFEQWEDVAAEILSGHRARTAGGSARGRAPLDAAKAHPTMWRVLFGRGVGNYGISRGMTQAANTHNLFLNQYVATGLPGFATFTGLFLLVLVRGWRAVHAGSRTETLIRLGGLVGLAAIAMMGIVTQFEFSYLGTITGGSLFWVCAFVSRWNGETRAVPEEEAARDKIGFEPSDVFALSVYPVSEPFLRAVGMADARPVSLAELRGSGISEMLHRLRRIRAQQGVAIVEDPAMTPLAPILFLLLAATRCSTLHRIGPGGDSEPLRRTSAFRWCWELGSATLAGLAAVVRQAAISVVLSWRPRIPLGPDRVTGPWLYLRTTLWGNPKAGGSVGHVAGVVNALHRGKVDVAVVAADRPPMVDSSVPFHPSPGLDRIGFPYEFNDYRLDGAVYEFLRKQPRTSGPSVIYHRATRGGLVATRLSRLFKAALVLEYNGPEVWIADHWGRSLKLKWLTQLCENVNLRHAHLIVVVSEVLKAEVLARGVEDWRVVVCPNGIDLAVFDPMQFSAASSARLRESLAIPETAVVAGFLGTYGPWHGAEVFAEAARRLIAAGCTGEEGRPLYFLFIGDGLRMSTVRAILEHSVDGGPVRYTGLVPQAQAPSYLAACDILVSPHVCNPDGSRFFGSPTKLFEYMAMGKAIAASDLEQIGEVLKESYKVEDLPPGPVTVAESRLAVLSPPGDVDGLVKAVAFLAGDPDYRRALGANAQRKAAANYTWDSVAIKIQRQLAEVLKSGQVA